jgi:hypothetical protein
MSYCRERNSGNVFTEQLCSNGHMRHNFKRLIKCQCMNMYVGTSGIDGDWRPDSRPGHFTTADRALGSHSIGGWMRPRDSLYAKGNRRI